MFGWSAFAAAGTQDNGSYKFANLASLCLAVWIKQGKKWPSNGREF